MELDRNSVKRETIAPGAVVGPHFAQGLFNVTHVMDQVQCGAGTLPTATFTTYQPYSDVLFWLGGTAYTTAGTTRLTVTINLDGVAGGGLSLFSNEANSHKALAGFTPVFRDVRAGLHTVTFTGGGTGFTVNTDDYYDLTAMELPVKKEF